ncbi:ubiquitin recognition factor in ER-associated degradation protein 1-like [Olea europaea var. sylvestris]|uniref:ubiquitin recognition factor in ER-associated degradation protein 1-like n=1 Tax=Olea europaea var. sylvestris TaxID=158386 RepID=UPI000C1D6716|nr:ubiquitin recognition factor in ER-associated degradation protein 1-like [Olea europaea var. sylvestris]
MDDRFSRGQLGFEQAYCCTSFSKSKKSELECGDKIVMPESALHALMARNIPHPYMFQIKPYYNPGHVSHCGISEFTADEGFIKVPDWMMENLNLQEGELVLVESALLPTGNFLKLQPHSTKFIQLLNPKAVLEKTLRRFSCLSTGDTIMVTHDNQKFYINVLETKPGPAICLIETDCEVDFAAPLDYKEPEKPEKVKENAPEKVEEEETEEQIKFRPFTGKGRRLDGESVDGKVANSKTQENNAPTTSGSSGGSGAVSASTTSVGGKKSGKLVFGSNGLERLSDDSRNDFKLQERKEQKSQAFTGKKHVLGSL